MGLTHAQQIKGLKVESLFDIAADKAHTISIRPRFRDFIDLYFILNEKKDWKLSNLLKKGQEKFEIIVDPIQLGENLTQVSDMADMPIMLKKVDLKQVRNFFTSEARKLHSQILE